MSDWIDRPNIRLTLYGKFLAVSACGAPVRIAVVGDTIEGASVAFAEAGMEWQHLLDESALERGENERREV